MHDHINDVLDRIGDRYLLEAACCRPVPAGRRRALRVLLIAACMAVVMTVGVTGWRLYLRPTMESDGVRRYTYSLPGGVPKNAPTEIETVWLPDLSVLDEGYALAFCNRKTTGAGDYISTCFRMKPGGQFSVSQMPFAVFENYTNKRASANYMPQEIRAAELGGREALCEVREGVVNDVIFTDGVYCYVLHSSTELTEAQWDSVIRSFHPVPDYAEIAAEHPYYHPDSGTLDTVLVPDDLPLELGGFSWAVTPYCAEWSIYNEAGYGLSFEQTPLDLRNYYTEDGDVGPYYGGEIVDWFILDGMMIYEGDCSGFWDYFWYEGGDRCQIRFDKETGLDFRPLARRIIESMTRVSPEAAKTRYEQVE